MKKRENKYVTKQVRFFRSNLYEIFYEMFEGKILLCNNLGFCHKKQ